MKYILISFETEDRKRSYFWYKIMRMPIKDFNLFKVDSSVGQKFTCLRHVFKKNVVNRHAMIRLDKSKKGNDPNDPNDNLNNDIVYLKLSKKFRVFCNSWQTISLTEYRILDRLISL